MKVLVLVLVLDHEALVLVLVLVSVLEKKSYSFSRLREPSALHAHQPQLRGYLTMGLVRPHRLQ